MIKKFTNEIYPFRVWVATATDEEDRLICGERLFDFLDYDTREEIKYQRFKDMVYKIDYIGSEEYGILILFYSPESINFKTVCHEIIHATNYLLETIGEKLEHSYLCAYIAGWVGQCCEEFKEEINNHETK